MTDINVNGKTYRTLYKKTLDSKSAGAKTKKFKFSFSDVRLVMEAVLQGGFKSAVTFVGRSNKMPIGKLKFTRKNVNDFVFTVGHLNYLEKKFAKQQLKVFGKVPKLKGKD